MPAPADSSRRSATAAPRHRILLCDADGTLFPSEEPAFAASAGVVDAAMAALGSPTHFEGDELRQWASGRNFRSVLTDLAAAHGRPLHRAELERWVAEEAAVVTRALAAALRPDPAVQEALAALGPGHRLALVSSSALRRLDVCLQAADLDAHFPAALRFSAQDSLLAPSSKPDPAIYTWALRRLGRRPADAVALEDAVSGVQSAVAAGIATVGITAFVPAAERAQRAADLREAGACEVVGSWADLADLLLPSVRTTA